MLSLQINHEIKGHQRILIIKIFVEKINTAYKAPFVETCTLLKLNLFIIDCVNNTFCTLNYKTRPSHLLEYRNDEITNDKITDDYHISHDLPE